MKWIEYGKTWQEFYDEGLTVRGVVFQSPKKKHSTKVDVFVIGDFNPFGGMCDCCSIDKERIILRYMQLELPEVK